MKKRIIAVLLAALFVLLSVPAAVFAEESQYGSGTADDEVYLRSGLLDQPELSKAEITELLEESAIVLGEYWYSEAVPEDFYVSEPVFEAPYEAGEIDQYYLQMALNRVNAFRRIARVGAVELSHEACSTAQHGAVLECVAPGFYGGNPHFPMQPGDMDDEFYEIGAIGATGNLAAPYTIVSAVDAWFNDTDVNNMGGAFGVLGHRSKMLYRYYGSFGIGVANGWCACGFDFRTDDYDAGNYDFVSFPSSGYFPNSTPAFDSRTGWSIELNSSRYMLRDRNEVTVTLTCEESGREWVFLGSEDYMFYNGDDGSYDYFAVNGNSLAFRPGNCGWLEGVYTVRVGGVYDPATGEDVDFAYQVEFFDADELEPLPSDGLIDEGMTIRLFTGSEHPFRVVTENGETYLESGNAGVSGSESFIKAIVYLNEGEHLYFSFAPCLGAPFDTFDVLFDGCSYLDSQYNAGLLDHYVWAEGGAGPSVASPYAGLHCIELVCVKPLTPAVSEGNDNVRVKDFHIEILTPAPTIPAPESSDATLDEALNVEGGALSFTTGGNNTSEFTVCVDGDRTAACAVLRPSPYCSYELMTTVTLDEGDRLFFDYKTFDYSYNSSIRLYVSGQYVKDLCSEGPYWTLGSFAADEAGEYVIVWNYGGLTDAYCMIDNVRIVLAGEPDPEPIPVVPTEEEAALNEALNYEGGELIFISPWIVPFEPASYNGRYVGKSPDGSESYVRTTVELEAGDSLVYEYCMNDTGDTDAYSFVSVLLDGHAHNVRYFMQTPGFYPYSFTAESSGKYTFTWCINTQGDAQKWCMLDNVRIVREGEPDPLYAELNDALNAEGGSIGFTMAEFGPFEPVWDGERHAAKSVGGNYSWCELYADVHLEEGDMLLFDYKVSPASSRYALSFDVPGIGYTLHSTTEWQEYVYTAETAGDYSVSWKYTHFHDPDKWCMIDNVRIVRAGEQTLPGDANGDGEVDVTDALIALRGAMGILNLSDGQAAAADVNGSGSVDAADALLILRRAMGLIEL